MAYQVMHMEKQQRTAMYGLEREANRTEKDRDKGLFPSSDIDWNKTGENIHLVENHGWAKLVTGMEKEMGIKERKNSVTMVTGLYSASPEWFDGKSKEEIIRYFRDCLDYHIHEYCSDNPDLVLNAVVHLDESTPHMHVSSVPIMQDEKGYHLSAKVVMGNMSSYRKHHTNLYKMVGKKYGLERGQEHEPYTQRAHTTKQEYDAARAEAHANQAREEERKAVENAERVKESITKLNKDRDEVERDYFALLDQQSEAIQEKIAAEQEANESRGFFEMIVDQASDEVENANKQKEIIEAETEKKRKEKEQAEEDARKAENARIEAEKAVQQARDQADQLLPVGEIRELENRKPNPVTGRISLTPSELKGLCRTASAVESAQEEISVAREIIRERNSILDKARSMANSIVQNAQAVQEALNNLLKFRDIRLPNHRTIGEYIDILQGKFAKLDDSLENAYAETMQEFHHHSHEHDKVKDDFEVAG